MLPEGSDLGAAFGITDVNEAAAFKQVFLLEPDQNKKMQSVGAFLMTGQAAAAGLQKSPRHIWDVHSWYTSNACHYLRHSAQTIDGKSPSNLGWNHGEAGTPLRYECGSTCL